MMNRTNIGSPPHPHHWCGKSSLPKPDYILQQKQTIFVGGTFANILPWGSVCQFLAKIHAKAGQRPSCNKNTIQKYIKRMTFTSFEGHKMLANVPF